MTLDTRIILKNPDVSPQAVLDFINRELLRADHPEPAPWPPQHLPDDYIEKWYAGVAEVGNRIGQGLFAIAQITYRVPLGPITSTYGTGWTRDGTPDQESIEDHLDSPYGWEPADLDLVTGSMEISFDTGYGFEVAGAHCGDLHAWFVVRLAEEYGPLSWQDECTGKWYPLDGKAVQQVYDLADRLGDPAKGQSAVETRESVTV